MRIKKRWGKKRLKILIKCQQIHINNESKKDKKAEQKQTHGYRDHFDSCQRREEIGGVGEKGGGLRSTNWLLQNSHGDVSTAQGMRPITF